MANQKISEDATAAAFDGSEFVAMVQTGDNVKGLVSQFLDYMESFINLDGGTF